MVKPVAFVSCKNLLAFHFCSHFHLYGFIWYSEVKQKIIHLSFMPFMCSRIYPNIIIIIDIINCRMIGAYIYAVLNFSISNQKKSRDTITSEQNSNGTTAQRKQTVKTTNSISFSFGFVYIFFFFLVQTINYRMQVIIILTRSWRDMSFTRKLQNVYNVRDARPYTAFYVIFHCRQSVRCI